MQVKDDGVYISTLDLKRLGVLDKVIVKMANNRNVHPKSIFIESDAMIYITNEELKELGIEIKLSDGA